MAKRSVTFHVVHVSSVSSFSGQCLSALTRCIPGMRLSFVQPLQDQTVKEGNSARFDLELSHENVPVVWYRNEVKLHVSRTVLIHVEGKRHTLEMRTLSLDDTCQIKAEAKGIYSMAKLTVVGNCASSFPFHFCFISH